MAHFEITLFFIPALYCTLIRPAPRTQTVSKPEGIVLLLLLPQLFLLGLAYAQPYPSVNLETTLGVCYLEEEKFRKRSVTVLAISYKGKMLDENCAEGWDVGHRSISTWGSASSSCGSPDHSESPIIGSNDRPEQLRTTDRALRVLAWVDYGSYGDTLLEDTSHWVLNKYSVKNNRTKRDEEIARVVESVSALSLSGRLSGIQHCSPGGTGAGGAGTKRDASSISHDAGFSSAAPNQPTHKKSRQSGGGGSGGSGNPRPGGVPIPGNEGQKQCPLPKECPGVRFQTDREVIQHIVARHRDKCCPVCEEKLVQVRGNWVYRGNSKDKFVFSTAVDMKWHIHRKHLKPYQCPVCTERYDKRGLKKHLGLYGGGNSLHSPQEFDRDSIEAVLSGPGYSNLGYPELETLVQKFDGAHTKAQMKDFLFPGPNRVKIYDCEDKHNIIDRLTGIPGPEDWSPGLCYDPFSGSIHPLPQSNNFGYQPTVGLVHPEDDSHVEIMPQLRSQSALGRTDLLQPATLLKIGREIKAKYDLTDDEFNSLNWVIIGKLPEFLQMLEEILNSTSTVAGTSPNTAKTLAKVMYSEASRPLFNAIFNHYLDDLELSKFDTIAPTPEWLFGKFL
ncbi:hypothetical protein BDD12DRAFT_909427 [Trichophaea hybrida]|nr:hypothetical protein BDD12DRAFT_909427 [Trichophaea hybrida]